MKYEVRENIHGQTWKWHGRNISIWNQNLAIGCAQKFRKSLQGKILHPALTEVIMVLMNSRWQWNYILAGNEDRTHMTDCPGTYYIIRPCYIIHGITFFQLDASSTFMPGGCSLWNSQLCGETARDNPYDQTWKWGNDNINFQNSYFDIRSTLI